MMEIRTYYVLRFQDQYYRRGKGGHTPIWVDFKIATAFQTAKEIAHFDGYDIIKVTEIQEVVGRPKTNDELFEEELAFHLQAVCNTIPLKDRIIELHKKYK